MHNSTNHEIKGIFEFLWPNTEKINVYTNTTDMYSTHCMVEFMAFADLTYPATFPQ